MNEHFGIGPGAEYMTSLLQLQSQLEVVVDLAVVRDYYLAVLVRQRLRAAGNIDDAQTDVRETNCLADIEAIAIGAAVLDRRGHFAQRCDRDTCIRVPRYARNAAHQALPMNAFTSIE